MQRFAHLARCGFASGMISLGVIGLWFHDFALVWGRLPGWVPWRAALVVVCAVVPLAAGIILLVPRAAARASLVLFWYVGLWWLLLKVPAVIRAPGVELTWLDAGMYGMLLSGAWTLYADLGGGRFLGGERGKRLALLFFGICLIPTGLSHFVYLNFTAPLVPAYFPYPVAWAYFTGACHLAAGLSILFGVLPRLAAQLESLMLLIFTVLVWVPRVVAGPGVRGNWTEFWLSWVLTAAAAVVAAHAHPRSRPAA